MNRSRATFEKLQRERDKQAKATAKRERRQAPSAMASREETATADVVPTADAESVLAMVEKLHARFERSEISFEEYEMKKTDLLGRLTVD